MHDLELDPDLDFFQTLTFTAFPTHPCCTNDTFSLPVYFNAPMDSFTLTMTPDVDWDSWLNMTTSPEPELIPPASQAIDNRDEGLGLPWADEPLYPLQPYQGHRYNIHAYDVHAYNAHGAFEGNEPMAEHVDEPRKDERLATFSEFLLKKTIELFHPHFMNPPPQPWEEKGVERTAATGQKSKKVTKDKRAKIENAYRDETGRRRKSQNPIEAT